MKKHYIQDHLFQQEDFRVGPLPYSELENCRFVNCQFAGADLSELVFEECRFEGCDLSNAQIRATAFKSVHFKDCKLLGLQFDTCHQFLLAFSFEACVLDFSVFYQLKLKGTRFVGCKLKEVDFTQADLPDALFQDCDLSGAVFDQTGLEGADLRSANQFTIDPLRNRLKKAIFSRSNLEGLLTSFHLKIVN